MGIHTYYPPTEGGSTSSDSVYKPPRNPVVHTITQGGARLRFTVPLGPIPAGTYIKGYEWEAGQRSSSGFNVVRQGGTIRFTVTVTGLEASTTYQIRIRAAYWTRSPRKLAGHSEFVYSADFTTLV